MKRVSRNSHVKDETKGETSANGHAKKETAGDMHTRAKLGIQETGKSASRAPTSEAPSALVARPSTRSCASGVSAADTENHVAVDNDSSVTRKRKQTRSVSNGHAIRVEQLSSDAITNQDGSSTKSTHKKHKTTTSKKASTAKSAAVIEDEPVSISSLTIKSVPAPETIQGGRSSGRTVALVTNNSKSTAQTSAAAAEPSSEEGVLRDVDAKTTGSTPGSHKRSSPDNDHSQEIPATKRGHVSDDTDRTRTTSDSAPMKSIQQQQYVPSSIPSSSTTAAASNQVSQPFAIINARSDDRNICFFFVRTG